MVHGDWESYVTEVREKSAGLLRDLVEEKARLFPIGRGKYKCLSPIRAGDTDPSFHLNEELGFWHDFGTDQSGDALAFVRLTENANFREALDSLAQRAGIPTWDERKKNGSSRLTNEELLEIWQKQEDAHEVRKVMTDIVLLCHAILPDRIRAYLEGHYGLTKETIDDEKIGWCPDGLYPFCKEVWPKVDEGVLMATGFFLVTQVGTKTHLGGRILFPYWKDGQVVYTIGREHHWGLPQDQVTIENHDLGKYKKHLVYAPNHAYVSPYISNDHFWGEDTLREGRGRTGYITEGVTDAIMLRQLGFPVISPVTKEFKEKTIPRAIDLLQRCKEVVILNDNEEKIDKKTGEVRNPGMEGALRMARALHLSKIHVRIGLLPRPENVKKIDVNDIGTKAIRRGGLEAAKKEIEEISGAAKPIVLFLLEQARIKETKESLTLDAITKLVTEIGELSVQANKLEQDLIVASVRETFPKLGLDAVRSVLKDAKKAVEKREKEEAEKNKEEEVREKRIVRGVRDELFYYERYAPGDKEPISISTFTLVLKHVTVHEHRGEPDLLCVDVVVKDGKIAYEDWIVPARAWTSAKDFVRSFPSMHMQWFGSDLDVMSVYQMLTEGSGHIHRIRSVHTLGLHAVEGKRRFVVMAGTLDETGWMKVPDTVFSSNRGSTLQALLPTTQTDPSSHVDLLRKVLEKSYTLQCSELAFPMISWFGSSMFKPELYDKYSGFPILMIYGTQGSGKTSATRLFWRLFTGGAKAGLGSTQTKFTLISDVCSSTSIPVFFDEYRPEKMSMQELNTLNNTLRLAYDNAIEPKGKQNLGFNVFRMSSPIILAGEHAMDEDPALNERMIFAAGNKNWLERSDQAAFLALDVEPVEKCAPFLYRWRTQTDLDPIYRKAEESFTQFFAMTTKKITVVSRVKHNLEQLFVGYFALATLAADLQVRLPEIDLFSRMEDVLLRIVGVERQVTNEIVSPRTALDTFLYDFVIMAIQGEVREDIHYAQLNGDLFVHTDSVYEMRAAWKRTSGKSSDSVGLRGLKQIAAENAEREGYVRRVSHTGRLLSWRDLVNEPKTPQQLAMAQRHIEEKVGPREVQARGLLIDLEKLPAWIGRPPLTFDRTQGKSRTETDIMLALEAYNQIDPSRPSN